MCRFRSLMIFLFLFLFVETTQAQNGSFEIIEGVVVTDENISVTVGPGTFIPEPWNQQLAIEILGYREKIEKLELDLDSEVKKFDIYKNASREREDKIKEYMGDRYKSIYLENVILKGPWNKYGKVILWCAATATAMALVTYLFCRETDKYGC